MSDALQRSETTPLSSALNAMRWMAATAVLLTHLDNRVFVSHSSNLHVSSGYFSWLFSVGFAHKAVIVFFVLSGWLVGGKVLHDVFTRGDMNLSRYLFDRLARLWIVLLPALALTYALDGIGSSLAGGEQIYASTEPSRTIAGLACNALFLQTVVCRELGSNGALWSLANEFWYYALWPLLLAPWMKAKPARVRWALFSIGCSAAALLLLQLYGIYDIVPYFAIWMLGAAARMLPAPVIRSPLAAAAILGIFFVATRLFIRSEMVSTAGLQFALDIATAVCIANLLTTLAHWKGVLPRILRHPIHTFLAERSYSLYAIHTPIVMLACAVLGSNFQIGWHMQPSGALVWLALAGIFLLTLLLTALFAHWTELRTPAIKRALASWWTSRRFQRVTSDSQTAATQEVH